MEVPQSQAKEVDYATVHCPQAERIYRDEAVVLSHRLFLGPQSDMDCILDAIRKIRDQRRRGASRGAVSGWGVGVMA